ncbi:MAG: LysR family transcriptional regulator [Chitinophagales bacterium]|jgi:LysR family hydrogen peroxide-inducible transcriptional activator|nr:LysR family transcriptional regulator [Bacteroidota bacterium]MBK7569374.1 LysR family transcriptional regulator [Bacteroidota bacterium]MBP8915279.1 LysR family transcriptional regulator [Chitinophagales bacterium]MBP9219896.1 LysR family transcriptional regulator [Chitinophagales bacterium]MBP9794437.1 LysR family transcriptional regulator [Chitinophagales bacterium]
MNLQQLDYIIAVDTYRHFLNASEKCFVTQATLSMMIRKLEDELGVKIFDRSKLPVKPTEIGVKIIAQARRVVAEAGRIQEIIIEESGEVTGELKIGIIPTLAPYLLPIFLREFQSNYPDVKLVISEHTTDNITQRLKSGQIDVGILATPLNDQSIKEQVLFYEKYFLYVNAKETGFNKQYVLPANIDINRLWLLEEGHCMRSQILNFCELKKQHEVTEKLHYEAGSIETLKNLVEKNFGVTIIPELATFNLTKTQQKRLRYFKPPFPVREISLVTHREYIKFRLIEVLKETILTVIPEGMKKQHKMNVLEI